MARISFCHHTAHVLVEPHGVFIVRAAIAGKTVDLSFIAVVLQDRKGLFTNPYVLILLEYIQGVQLHPGVIIPKNEISDIFVTVFDQIYREEWV